MAARFDAAARLAEGRPVIDDLTEYVAACRQLGYRHSDLTAHAGQVAEWYSAQDGLDLAALDTDAAALRHAAAETDDVAREQAAAVAALRDGWAGSGGGAAVDFLTRHQRAAESVVAGARVAADALTALREELWRAVDAQVTATLDAGAAAQRETWLAASHTLTTGAGDRATASELVDREVKPFVDNVIGGRWVAAMRAASEAVAGAYQAAVTRLGGSGTTVFEVPVDFGPRAAEAVIPQAAVPRAGETTGGAVAPASAPSPGVSGPVAPAAFSPQEAAAPAAAPPVAPAPLSAPVEPGVGAPAASTPALPSLPSLGESGGMGAGTSGFGSGLADLLGGLGGLSDGGEFDPDQVDTEPADVDDEEPEDEDDDDPESDEDEEEAGDDAVGEPDGTGEVAPVPDGEPEPEPEPAPTPPPVEPLAAPPPPPPPVEAPPERTPCEIAADELPQVGE